MAETPAPTATPTAARAMLAEGRTALRLWAPVLLAIGIGGYFALPVEPRWPAYAAAAIILALCLATRGLAPQRSHVPAVSLALVAAGFLLAGYRAHDVAAPVLPFRAYGPVEGRIVDIDRSFSDALRITLDRVTITDVRPGITPARVRISLHGEAALFEPQPGQTVRLTANLAPPDGPVAPGGFDFQRLAWFNRLGAVGYSRKPVEVLAPPEDSLALAAFRVRMQLSRAMQDRMEGQAGALSSAFMTGDRSGVSAETNEIMRASNLSHMISISGLHMGLLVGFIFALIRYGIAAIPPLALRLPAKKIAAAVALVAATGYLALAGPDVATERAYIMAAVMLAAVLVERRGVTLRTLAIAAFVLLAAEPESLTEPGFQMSFGATAALILVFEPWSRVQHRVPVWLRPGAMTVLSSLVAGLATAPIAAAHFNRFAGYGLVANLLAVPAMGIVVMPAGIIAALLAPFGLEGPALWAMREGTEIILLIAAWVAGLDGAVRAIAAPPGAFLPLFAMGALGLGLGRVWLKAGGAVMVTAALVLWSTASRPDLLIAGNGEAVGVLTDEGRALSKPKGAGFIVTSWLEDDGDLADQETAFARGVFLAGKGRSETEWAGRVVVHLTGKTAPERALAECRDNAILVLDGRWDGKWVSEARTGPGACEVWDQRRLRYTGAVAIWRDGESLRVVTAKEVAGDRLWNRRTKRPPREDAEMAAAP